MGLYVYKLCVCNCEKKSKVVLNVLYSFYLFVLWISVCFKFCVQLVFSVAEILSRY
jgi:hypothetical protein